MEIKAYIYILIRRWWLIASVFAVAVIATGILTAMATPTYQASTTYIVSPSSSSTEDSSMFLRSLDTLTLRNQVPKTYADVAISRSVRNEAAATLGLSVKQIRSLSVQSKVRAETNIIEITVTGSAPDLVESYANAVGQSTVNYVKDLYGIYDLKVLDPAMRPSSPIKPVMTINLALAAVLSLILGVGLVFVYEYLVPPPEK